jgi:hypothetical protein
MGIGSRRSVRYQQADCKTAGGQKRITISPAFTGPVLCSLAPHRKLLWQLPGQVHPEK